MSRAAKTPYGRFMAGAQLADFCIGDLAQIVHEAEEKSDDVTFMAAIDEALLTRKIPDANWKDLYNIEWQRRMSAKTGDS
jgi:hypothetical protein